eukprot:COSAG05_NODE_823_length_7122_cov_13.546917_2_plen_168_part_00
MVATMLKVRAFFVCLLFIYLNLFIFVFVFLDTCLCRYSSMIMGLNRCRLPPAGGKASDTADGWGVHAHNGKVHRRPLLLSLSLSVSLSLLSLSLSLSHTHTHILGLFTSPVVSSPSSPSSVSLLLVRLSIKIQPHHSFSYEHVFTLLTCPDPSSRRCCAHRRCTEAR